MLTRCKNDQNNLIFFRNKSLYQ